MGHDIADREFLEEANRAVGKKRKTVDSGMGAQGERMIIVEVNMCVDG